MHYLDQQGNYYTGEKAPGGIEINAKPSGSHKLRADWKFCIPNVWELDLDGLKQSKITLILNEADLKFNEILSKYPKGEVDTWSQKVGLAQAWLAFSDQAKAENLQNNEFSMLFNESLSTSTPVEADIPKVTDLATRIIRSKNIYSTFAGLVLNKKTELLSLVKSATTETEVKDIPIDYSSVSLSSITSQFPSPNSVPSYPTDPKAEVMRLIITSTGQVYSDYTGATRETHPQTPASIIGSVLIRYADGTFTLTLPNGDISPITTEQELASFFISGI